MVPSAAAPSKRRLLRMIKSESEQGIVIVLLLGRAGNAQLHDRKYAARAKYPEVFRKILADELQSISHTIHYRRLTRSDISVCSLIFTVAQRKALSFAWSMLPKAR